MKKTSLPARLNRRMGKLLIFSFLALLLILPFGVGAYSVKTNDNIYVAKDETVEGNLYAAGANITVDGTVTGDVICGGQTININGTVEGDVICGGQTININGTVNGNVRAAGNSININGPVARNVMAFGATIALSADGSVGWDMLTAGAIGEIRGKIGRDLYGALASADISGEIGGSVKLQIDDKIKKEKKGFTFDDKDKSKLNITDTAIIGGMLSYTAVNEASVASGASIIGEITHNAPKIKKDIKKGFGALWGLIKLYSIFSALVIGLVLISLWSNEIKKMTDKMIGKTGPSIGWGVVIMFLTPIIALLLVITLIGIPLAGLLMLVWLIMIWISKLIVGILVGRKILEKYWKKYKDSMIWAMVIGITLSQIIFSIPIIGWLLCLVAIWWGLGGIYMFFKKS